MDQAKRDAAANGNGNIPTVFHKKNNAEILVTLPFDGFMNLYREYEINMSAYAKAETDYWLGHKPRKDDDNE